jgi:PAS domain S-box-containing protein
MSFKSFFQHNLLVLLLAIAPLAILGCVEILVSPRWAWYLWTATLLLTALGLFIGLAISHRRLGRRVEGLIDTYRELALGQQVAAMGPKNYWDLIDRLELAVQVMHSALVDRLSLYRRFFDAAPDMFLTVMAAGGRIIDANPAFCSSVGLLPNEVLDQSVDKFVNLDKDWEFALNHPGELISGVLNTDKGACKIEASVSHQPSPDGAPWIMGLILRDVSVREALHQEIISKSAALERALEEIRNVEELKDQFLTTLSHELKTPLVSLKGFLQLLASGRVQPAEQAEYLEICMRNLGKLEKQINNLLDLARLTHSKELYELGKVDLAALLRTEAENLNAMAAKNQVRLNLDGVPAAEVFVHGNAGKLEQLVDNLLMNAVKYNIEGGSVEVNLQPRNGKVVLVVADSGIGMAREQMAKIFNYYYRVESGGHGRLEGLGIGLSLVQEIVKLHEGDITVDSKPGQGTTFTVTLHAAK